MALKFNKWDTAQQLKTEEDVARYWDDCLEEGGDDAAFAARLRTSTATVYPLCERGQMPYVRISTHAIQIGEQDPSAFLGSNRSGET